VLNRLQFTATSIVSSFSVLNSRKPLCDSSASVKTYGLDRARAKRRLVEHLAQVRLVTTGAREADPPVDAAVRPVLEEVLARQRVREEPLRPHGGGRGP
jgi:hypothetical protein